jgi:hypothetical protein
MKSWNPRNSLVLCWSSHKARATTKTVMIQYGLTIFGAIRLIWGWENWFFAGIAEEFLWFQWKFVDVPLKESLKTTWNLRSVPSLYLETNLDDKERILQHLKQNKTVKINTRSSEVSSWKCNGHKAPNASNSSRNNPTILHVLLFKVLLSFRCAIFSHFYSLENSSRVLVWFQSGKRLFPLLTWRSAIYIHSTMCRRLVYGKSRDKSRFRDLLGSGETF